MESILESNTAWWDLTTLCRRVFKSHQFKNIHVEVLYQRYFLRMNQASMMIFLALLLLVVLGMLALLTSLGLAKFAIHAATLSVFAILYLALEILLWRSRLLNEVYLIIFSYLVLISFFGLELLVTLSCQPPTASSGVWATLFFVYMTYTLLPLRFLEATGGGVLLSLTHVICTLNILPGDTPFLWQQVSVCVCVCVCVCMCVC